jgi:hypothetical protein
MHDPVALERGEVRAHGVIGYAKRLSKLLYGVGRPSQLSDNLPPCRHQKLAVPIHLALASVPSKVAELPSDFNKSIEYLTLCGFGLVFEERARQSSRELK